MNEPDRAPEAPACFLIEEIVEVHRDPGGHYHHWSIVVGRLKTGALAQGEFLQLPTSDGSLCSGRTGGFEAFHRLLPAKIHAEEIDFLLGVMIIAPAPPRAVVCPGEAFSISREEHEANLLALLRGFPERLFHTQGGTPFRCRDCPGALRGLPAARPLLEALREHHLDAAVARHARELLLALRCPLCLLLHPREALWPERSREERPLI